MTQRNLYAVAMVQADAYWAVGEAGTLVHSDDGGATWAVQPPPLDLTAALYGVRYRPLYSLRSLPLDESEPFLFCFTHAVTNNCVWSGTDRCLTKHISY